MEVNLIYVPEMKAVAEFFRKSPHYKGERIFSLEAFAGLGVKGKPLMIGRNGKYHHHDLKHMELLKRKRLLPSSDLTTLVLFDRHDDYDYNRTPIDKREYDYLNEGCWVSRGVLLGFYSNAIIAGVDSKGVCYPLKLLKENRCSSSQLMKWLDEVEIYTCGEGFSEDKHYPEYEHLLESNKSVLEYQIIEDKYIQIRFKSIDEISYAFAKSHLIVSTDLDVLNESEMVVDYWQGGLTTEQLIHQINGLPKKIAASIVSGFTEAKSLRTEHAMTNMSRILAAYSSVLKQS